MIFPGMDPYLELPQLWAGVHASLIVYIRNQLQPLLRPRYLASIEERVYLEEPERELIPDVQVRHHRPESPRTTNALLEMDVPVRIQVTTEEIHETYVTILDRQSGERVVTVIEVLSPTNKYAGPGRISYLSKQKEVLSGPVHLVEIDLLRAGPHVLAVPERYARTRTEYDYMVCVNQAREKRNEFDLYPRRVRDRLPRVRMPLVNPDPEVPLDIQALVAQVYEDGSYADRCATISPVSLL